MVSFPIPRHRPSEQIATLLAARRRSEIDAPDLPRAAVLALLYERAGDDHVVLTVRSHQVEHHKGQISFVGGVLDPEDGSLEMTALRESAEEIGIDARQVTILGKLDDLITVSNFLVTPFVGRISYPFRYSISNVEVAQLLEVPVPDLLAPGCFSAAPRPIPQEGRLTPGISYEWRGHIIWGATGGMLQQLLEVAYAPGAAPRIRAASVSERARTAP